MAIRKLKRSRLNSQREARLRKALVAEIERPDDAPTPPGAPVIYREESGTPERYTRWYIVWKRFDGVDSEDRSRVILDAVEQVFDRQAALRVSIAMGLTPDDPIAKDLAGDYEFSVSPGRASAVAEGRAKYAQTGESRKTKGRRK